MRWSVMLHAACRETKTKWNIYIKKKEEKSMRPYITYGAFERFILRGVFELPLSVSQFIESISMFLFHFSSSSFSCISYAFQQFLSAKWFMSMVFGVLQLLPLRMINPSVKLRWNFMCVALVFSFSKINKINFPSQHKSRWKIRFVSMFPKKTILLECAMDRKDRL